mgnify:CR=1|jgi:hypothetical protein|tara:strand:+ start:512 stop:1048 length:537 start_codon:yes stop_codon:yes gene_type:complete
MYKNLFISLSFLVLVSGCGATIEEQPVGVLKACPIPTGNSLVQAVDEGYKTTIICPGKFEVVFHALLEVAKKDPNMSNWDEMKRYVDRLQREKVVPPKMARDLFNSYLGREMVALRSNYSIYSHKQNPEKLLGAVDEELRKKLIGWVRVLGNEKKYQELQKRVAQFKLSFGALTKTLP